MTSQLITPPAILAVDLASAKSALKIDDDAQDALVEAWLGGIIAHAEHLTGRSFIAQTWRATLPAFPYDRRVYAYASLGPPSPYAVRLPSSPLISITKFTYIDTEGVERTLTEADYEIVGDYLVPADGAAWPSTRAKANAVKVEGVFGYGATVGDVPASVRLYILAKLVESFDPAVRLEKDTVQASFIDRLLDRVKVYS